MKAILREPKPCVLAFNFTGERLEGLQSACEALQYRFVHYTAAETPEAFTAPLGDLLEGHAPSASDLAQEMKLAMNALAFPDELLYLADLSNDGLDAFLSELQKRALRVPLKAVATPTNGSWKPMALRSELMEEHAAMQTAMEARRQQNEA